ncbi:PaREP1 family protein [Vulcanisaeta moutnovskia 768-28]|uniref:PaREP1 family protein n=1 Tax=Vulcanisaeta moutnovskia (strain 768-28) TaxID=985053 RepID=F0QY65_VULM7|nr:PaREP1 family protein [Vulcanisaeta moutnovskia 768-28]
MSIEVPRTLYEETMKKGVDVNELAIDTLIKALNLDPETTARARLELATKYLKIPKRGQGTHRQGPGPGQRETLQGSRGGR